MMPPPPPFCAYGVWLWGGVCRWQQGGWDCSQLLAHDNVSCRVFLWPPQHLLNLLKGAGWALGWRSAFVLSPVLQGAPYALHAVVHACPACSTCYRWHAALPCRLVCLDAACTRIAVQYTPCSHSVSVCVSLPAVSAHLKQCFHFRHVGLGCF